MATKKQDSDLFEAVCLLSCGFGQCGEVVSLTKDELKSGVDQGQLDPHQEAIKYAKS